MLRNLIVALMVLSLAGCKSMQVIDHPNPSSLRQQLVVGERVSVLTKGQNHYELRVTSVDEASFIGRDGKGKPWVVRYEQVEQIEGRQFSPARTGLLAGVIAGTVIFVVLTIRALANSLPDSNDDDSN